MWTMRCADFADLPDLVKIDRLGNANAWRLGQFESCLKSPHDFIYLIEMQNEIVAFIVWQTLFDESELHLIATHPNFRQRGLANALIEKMLQENQGNRFFLEVRQSNLPAQKLYAKHGFHIVGQRKNYYGDEDALIMEKSC